MIEFLVDLNKFLKAYKNSTEKRHRRTIHHIRNAYQKSSLLQKTLSRVLSTKVSKK